MEGEKGMVEGKRGRKEEGERKSVVGGERGCEKCGNEEICFEK